MVAEGYRRQVRADSVNMPMAEPGVFGLGVGRAVERVGLELDFAAERQRQQRADWDAQMSQRALEFEENSELARGGIDAAKLRGDMSALANEARATSAEGGVGHEAKLRAEWEPRRDAYLASFTSERVRQTFAQQMANFEEGFFTRENGWATAQQGDAFATNIERTIQTDANNIRNDNTREAVEAATASSDALIDGATLPEGVKRQLREHRNQLYSLASFERTATDNPAEARRQLASGAFNSVLTPAQIEKVQRDIEVEENRRRVAEAQALSAERTQTKSRIDAVERQLADGAPIADGVLEELQGLAQRFGLDAEEYSIGRARIQTDLNKTYAQATPAQIAEALAAADAKVAREGVGADVSETITANHLRNLLASRRSEVNGDPIGYAARLGRPVGEVDFNDPTSIARQAQGARAVAQQLGTPLAFLSADQAAVMRQRAEGSPAQRLALVNEVARAPAAEARAAMRQIAPNDRPLLAALTMPERYRAALLSGVEARRGNQQLVDDADTQVRFQRGVGNALAQLDAGFASDAIENGRNIAAGLAARHGRTAISDEDFANGLHAALGGGWASDGTKTGGIGRWRGAPVLLPAGMTQADFDGRLARMGPGAGAAMLSDGTSVSGEEMRRRFRPVAVRNGVYRFVDAAGGALLGRDRRILQVDVRRLP